nr:IS66 family insertion sequence element accessory protein TnpB [Pseudomonas asturiensis]
MGVYFSNARCVGRTLTVFDPVLFACLNKSRNRLKILYWERNGFCLWFKRLESECSAPVYRRTEDMSVEGVKITTR